jgi:uncharacterized membrane protein
LTTLDAIQWLTFALSAPGSFLATAHDLRYRFASFVLYLASNIVLATWGALTGNYGIMATQLVFLISTLIGLRKTWKPA